MLEGLSEHDTRPIAQTIEASARAAARHTPLRFDGARVPSSVQPDPPTRAALVHIAREAVANAVKHARPNAIEVVLEHAGQWRLTVRDDGERLRRSAGQRPAVGGFGLGEHARVRPRARRRRARRQRHRRRHHGGGGAPVSAAPTVVIADDHPPIRLGVRMAMMQGGFRVLAEADDADGAVEAVLRERPDACLLDVRMPGGGIEAAVRLGSSRPTRPW